MLTVIVPVHNAAPYLKRCLDSLARIQNRDVSFFLMENASTDSSLKICEECAAVDTRFRVFKLDKAGVSNARNVALNACDDEYVTFVDADDYIDSEVFERNFELFCDSGTDMGISPYIKVGKGRSRPVSSGLEAKIYGKQEVVFDILKMHVVPGVNFFGAVWRVFFRRSVIGSQTFSVDMSFHEDVDFLIRILVLASRVIVLDTPYYYYVLNPMSASSNSKVNKAKPRLDLIRKIEKVSSEYGIDFKEAISQRKMYYASKRLGEISKDIRGFAKLSAIKAIHCNEVSLEDVRRCNPAYLGRVFRTYVKLRRARLDGLALMLLVFRYFF